MGFFLFVLFCCLFVFCLFFVVGLFLFVCFLGFFFGGGRGVYNGIAGLLSLVLL